MSVLTSPRSGSPTRLPERTPPSIGSTAVSLAALLLLCFVAEVVMLGPVRYARAQSVGYAELRRTLAEATAPTGQVDGEGKLVAEGTPLALLAIPKLGLKDVVREGSTSELLMQGPGHRRDTPLPGQAGVSVVLGRQAAYGGPFRELGRLAAGDQIAVTTAQGSHLFEVVDLRRAGDPIPAFDPQAGWLTLVTGDGHAYAPGDVLRVDARLVSPLQPAGGRPITSAVLPTSEQPMGGDRSATLPVLLWAQLLLLSVSVLTWTRAVWGRWQTWVVAAPVLAYVGLSLCHQVARLLPNLL